MLNCMHNLRMDPSCDYFREAVINGAEQMMKKENIETSTLKAELAIQFQERGCSLLPARYLGLKNLFVALFGTDKWLGFRKTVSSDAFFSMALSSYKDLCEERENADGGMDKLIDRDSWVPAADMVFVRLVRFFNVVKNHNSELSEWTPKKIAESILNFMYDHYSTNFPSEYTVEEDMIDCLMHT